jgi:hypothetical protein
VADALLRAGLLDGASENTAAAFALGNVAPDSGVPTPDGKYLPDKNTSHFMRRFEGVPAGQNPERCDPFLLAREWIQPALERKDLAAVAFYLGYLSHLVTDNAWVRDFIYPAKVRFSHLRLTNGVETPEGVARFYAFLKKDWYDMDFLYLRRHPDLPAYRMFLNTPRFDNDFLPFFPADAFEVKRGEIEAFYRKGVSDVAEREVYVSEKEAEGFIGRVAEEVLDGFGDLFEDFCSKLTLYSQI